MVDGMATKKYTVTLPEELAEAIRAEVGPGGFSRYVTHAIERQRERERLGEAVDWWESEYGKVSDAEMADAAAERRDIERAHARLAEERQAAHRPGSDGNGRAA
jgi:Arc/MetJ-type ribon-helix-helix transcriptional regulator